MCWKSIQIWTDFLNWSKKTLAGPIKPAQLTRPTRAYQRMVNGWIIREPNFYGRTTVFPQNPTRAHP